MTSGDKLTRKQAKAIAALMSTRHIEDAAEKVGINKRTLYRWMNNPIFLTALREAEGDAIDQAVRQLIILQEPAISVIVNIMAKGEDDQVKLRAAQGVVKSLTPIRALRNTEERISRLEMDAFGEVRDNK